MGWWNTAWPRQKFSLIAGFCAYLACALGLSAVGYALPPDQTGKYIGLAIGFVAGIIAGLYMFQFVELNVNAATPVRLGDELKRASFKGSIPVHLFVDNSQQWEVREPTGEMYISAPYAIAGSKFPNLAQGFEWKYAGVFYADARKVDEVKLKAGSVFLFDERPEQPAAETTQRDDFVDRIYSKLKK